MRQTQITINVELDENHVPEKMTWNAQDGGVENQETKATMISVWDEKKQWIYYASIYGLKICL